MTRPPVIWVTVVLSGLLMLAATIGLVKDVAHLSAWLREFGLLPTVRVVAIQALLAGFLMGVLHASLARPRWASVLCRLFAILLAVRTIYQGFHPDPHPLFSIEPGAEQAGATFATWAMMVLGVLYAYHMLRGAKARTYFSTPDSCC